MLSRFICALSLANPGKHRYFSAAGENVLVQKTLTRDWQQLTALRTKPLTDKAMESFQLARMRAMASTGDCTHIDTLHWCTTTLHLVPCANLVRRVTLSDLV